MRIGINARLLLKRKAGIGYFTDRVYRSLLQNVKDDEIFYYTDKEFSGFRGFGLNRIKNRKIRKPLYLVWINTILKSQLNRDNIDVLLTPNYTPPVNLNCKNVVVFHDLAYFTLPDIHPNNLYREYMKWSLPRIAQKADHIIATSYHTKSDIVEILKIPENKISVVYQAPSNIFSTEPEKNILDTVKNKFGLEDRFLLFTGSIDERKNIETAIDALGIYHKNKNDIKLKLVLAGNKDKMMAYTKSLQAHIKKRNLEKSVIFTGYLEEKELIALYWGASAFIFPSLYEGFGVPLLEAMSAGLPIIASDISSIPELVQDAGLLIEPKNTQGFAEAIDSILNSETLSKEFIERGYARAKGFSWDKTGKEILAILKDAAS